SNFAGYGGGIYNSGSLEMIDAVISGNGAKADGGGIYTTSTVWLKGDTSIGTVGDGNRSGGNGGGIFVDHGWLYGCATCAISGNAADSEGETGGTGGGINSYMGYLTVPEGTVFENTPDQVV